MKLIVMGCCATKRAAGGVMPAIDRYDGPMWRSLRVRIAELPDAAAAVAAGELKLMVLSAKLGLIGVDVPIEDYDLRLTDRRAAEMLRDPSYDLQMLPHLVRSADAVLFAGGALYRDTMWKASGSTVAQIMKISETDGAGIGVHRAELGARLYQHYASMRLAA